MSDLQARYLERLAELRPTIAAAPTGVINLEAILNLPKGTEHFLTDIYGGYEAFSHVLRNGSGAIRHRVNDVFGDTLSDQDKQTLATLIYYPREKMAQILEHARNRKNWYKTTLYRLVKVSKHAASKYTRFKVRKALPQESAYVVEGLIIEKVDVRDEESYHNTIIQTIIRVGRAGEFIMALCEPIQRLIMDHLHILGGIYDRGPGPHTIMDKLVTCHSLDIQWGNHDVLWMGAAADQKGCITNVIRICARYGDLDILGDGYGINLLPLATFSLDAYGDDPCTCFQLKRANACSSNEMELNIRMHKVIPIIQFEVEGQIIREHPEFCLDNRNLLHRVGLDRGTILLEGDKQEMLDRYFPIIDPAGPYRPATEENTIIERLAAAFRNCEKLQQHVRFLLAKGSLYKVYNGNLLYHGCIPLNRDGDFKEVDIYKQKYKGRNLYGCLDGYVKKAFMAVNLVERVRGRDMCWYIWLHQDSPLFGEDKMATFGRYPLADKETHREEKNPCYCMLENEDTVGRILEEFGLSPQEGHIISGRMPVKSKNGENPVKYGGKMLVINGDFPRAYQKETGITGYTLIYNSYGLVLATHEPFESTETAIEKESDMRSESTVVKHMSSRKLVGDTNVEKRLRTRIKDLEMLLEAYRTGRIVERFPVR